jgi:hypothetical protein
VQPAGADDQRADASAARGVIRLAGAAVVGGMLYPPVIGLMPATFGIATGLVGAVVLSVLGGIAIIASGRIGRRPGARP